MKINLLITFALVSTSLAQDALPETARRLKEGYTRAIEAASRPITERYIFELKRLKSEATKAGRLEEAVAIDNEISSFTAVDPKSLIDTYVGTWEAPDHKFFLTADGSARTSRGAPGKWVVSEESLVITWNNGRSYDFKISKNKDKLEGVEKIPNKSEGIKLRYIRIK